ncbi:lamin tail domain-containing protein [Aliifodinibius sp. S!AR15-10]|uniref:lamin tail domain-containing protein n=1 Tax=Aliifodinibius sp. S!AR15-10 TaxID=2950437 RepID=UPI00285D179D|nr:lamin tail domain-containing protein [Aliifodinibius sp. S!AR15-10]MDR8392211.1 lamin tail domain-containing protein [Aliifodinibius sp. S!AR15-10]
MKYILSSLPILLAFFIPSKCISQTLLIDENFSDGDLTSSPVWNGDTGSFTITDISGNNTLQLNAGDSGTTYLGTPSSAAYGTWSFFLRFDFSLSGSNNITVFLTSDKPDLSGEVTGYALVAGESGSDDIFKVVRYDDGTEAETVITGTTNVSSGGEYQVTVNRNSDGKWTLSVAEGYESIPKQEATGVDNTHTSSSYFGFKPEYTSTRADKFFFDDISISKAPIELSTIEVITNKELRVSFTGDLDPTTVQSSDMSINNNIGSPNSISVQNNAVTLKYSSAIPSGDYTLSVREVSDRSGTNLQENSTISFSLFDQYVNGDIVINEFMYDHPIGLAEYVELKNTSGKRFNLTGWQLGDANTPATIGSDTLILNAGEKIVISPDTSALLNTFGDLNYVEMSSFPTLNNSSGDAIRIYKTDDALVDSLFYQPGWGGENVALERRSPTVSSTYPENWGNSPSPSGGTPGRENKISGDTTPPSISDYEIIDSQTLWVIFNERIKIRSATNPDHFSLNGIPISSVKISEPDTAKLILDSRLNNASDYILKIHNVEDIFGNTIASDKIDFTYYEISEPDSGDIFINEFMADPPDGFTEYIELYNPTEKSLNLQNWTLNDNTGTREKITYSQYVLPPDSFVVIAPDSSLIDSDNDFSLVVMGNNFPSLNNGGDDIVIRDANGVLLDSLQYSSFWGSGEVALERRSTSLPGMYSENWGNAPNELGTPGQPNEISTDKMPPKLDSYEILSQSLLQLVFDERITSPSATALENYELSNSLSISSVDFNAPDTVRLYLRPTLENAERYRVTYHGLEDLFGNTSDPQNINFTYYSISKADSGDVFINEFAFDPSEGMTEFVELHNPTQKSFDLQGWTFNDNTGRPKILTQSQFIIPPDSFAVIAPDSTLLTSFPDLNLLTIGSRFSSLNNSGDEIVIHSSDGQLIDSLEYTADWSGEGSSLERRSTSVSAKFQANWAKAPSQPTPGSANAIGPDKTPPEVVTLEILDSSRIKIIFSEMINRYSATNEANFSITPSVDIQLISAVQDTITLYLTESLQSGTNYQITIKNLEDIFGNRMGPVSISREYLKYSKVRPGDIIINEILYQRSSSTGPEFVELFNRSSKNFDLSGWRFGDATELIDIPGDIDLKSGSYILLTGNEKLASKKSNGYFIPSFPSLNDDEDAVYVKSGSRITVDSLHYSEHWGGSDGISIERKDPDAASNDGSNWTSSNSDSGVSAGSKNHSFSPDETPPGVIFSTRHLDGLLEVRFNEFIQLTQDLSFSMDGAKLKIAGFDTTQANKILLQPPSTKSKKEKSITIAIQNLTDVKGNTTSSASIPVAQPVKPGDVVINEIMYNPLSKSDDNQPDQSEYIELRNTSDRAISLEGFQLHDAPDEHGETRTLVPVNSTSKFLPAGGHLLVYAEDETAEFVNSKVATFFELNDLNSTRTVRINRGTLSLASENDAIYLADSTGVTIDSVYYSRGWHNPNIMDTKGIALERINPNGPSGDASNWSSSTAEKGGTPGRKNSIFQTPANRPQEIGISFDPNPFSPDGDGYEDNLFINYKLDQPDYLLKVRIFDRYGRLIRKLADGKQAGYEGSLQWDGKTDEGNRNRIGIYIILFEAYNSTNGSDRTFKEIVVLARQM